jgi:hypothetical protein
MLLTTPFPSGFWISLICAKGSGGGDGNLHHFSSLSHDAQHIYES